jgi:hypothetical protein
MSLLFCLEEVKMVRVTDHFLGCIAFLCVEDPERNRLEPRGTAFAVSVPDRDIPEVEHCYLVTARHNLEAAQTDRMFVRINTENGFRDILTDRTEWQTHDSADVAALSFQEEQLERIPLSVFVGAEFPYHFRFAEPGRNFPISVGTELFFVGLFVEQPGRGRNLPIARFGNVSRMPTEPVVLTYGDGTPFEQVAYLAECRSWGGHSGSPTFCVFNLTEDGRPLRYIGFVGLVSAHYDLPTPVSAPGTGELFTAQQTVASPLSHLRNLSGNCYLEMT